MVSPIPHPVCRKTFVSSSHHKSTVTLETDHLVYCHDQKFIERKIYYKEMISAQVLRINHLFYFIIGLFLMLQVLIYFALVQAAPPLYPVLIFILFSMFFVFVILQGKCLYAVRVNRLGVDTYIFYTSRHKEAKAVAIAINETLKKLQE